MVVYWNEIRSGAASAASACPVSAHSNCGELEEESKDGWWRLGARLDLNHIL